MNFRNGNSSIKSLAAIAVLGAFLAACSGGGVESTGNKLNTAPNNTSIPKAITPSVPPPISSGSTNVGASGNEVIDDIAAGQTQTNQKLDAMSQQLDQIGDSVGDAESNSNWAKWLGIGIAGYLALQGIHNGVQMAEAGETTGDKIGKFFKGFAFNTDTDRVNHDNEKVTKASEGRIQANTSGWGAASVGAGQAAAGKAEEARAQAAAATEAGNNAGTRAEGAVALGTKVVAGKIDEMKGELSPKLNALILQANDTNLKVTEIKNSGATSEDVRQLDTKTQNLVTELNGLKTALDNKNLSEAQINGIRSAYEVKAQELAQLKPRVEEEMKVAIRVEAERAAAEKSQAELAAARKDAERLQRELDAAKAEKQQPAPTPNIYMLPQPTGSAQAPGQGQVESNGKSNSGAIGGNSLADFFDDSQSYEEDIPAMIRKP